MQAPCCQRTGLGGMGCSTSSPAPFGDTLLIPKAWEPASALCLPILLLALLCCLQLLELPVNPKYLSCSAHRLHLKRSSSEEEEPDQTAFLGSKAFTIKTFQRKEVVKLLSRQHVHLACQEPGHLPCTDPGKLKPYANSTALRPRPATTHSLYSPTLPPQPLA